MERRQASDEEAIVCPRCSARNVPGTGSCYECGEPLPASFAEDLSIEERQIRNRRHRHPGGRILRKTVLSLGVCSCAVLFLTGIGNIIGLVAGITGVILASRDPSPGPGRSLCIIGIAVNSAVLLLIVAGSITLANGTEMMLDTHA